MDGKRLTKVINKQNSCIFSINNNLLDWPPGSAHILVDKNILCKKYKFI